MVYVVLTINNIPANTFNLSMTQNKIKVSQSAYLDIIAAFPKQVNAKRDLLPFILRLGNRETKYIPPRLWATICLAKLDDLWCCTIYAMW